MKGKLKNARGITLIALVITIIVLLILAGVTIATLTGQNGILTQANTAKTQTERAKVIEGAKTDVLGIQTENKDGKFYIKVSGNAADVTEQFDCIITKDGSPVSVCLISFF